MPFWLSLVTASGSVSQVHMSRTRNIVRAWAKYPPEGGQGPLAPTGLPSRAASISTERSVSKWAHWTRELLGIAIRGKSQPKGQAKVGVLRSWLPPQTARCLWCASEMHISRPHPHLPAEDEAQTHVFFQSFPGNLRLPSQFENYCLRIAT